MFEGNRGNPDETEAISHRILTGEDGHFQLLVTNSHNGQEMCIDPLRDWQTGKVDSTRAEIYFKEYPENTYSLSKNDLEALSLPLTTTTKEFMVVFGNKYGHRWEDLDLKSSDPDIIFEKLFPEVTEARQKEEAIDRANVLNKLGLK